MTDREDSRGSAGEKSVMKRPGRVRVISAVFLAVLLTGALLLLLWLKGVFLPSWIEWDKGCCEKLPEGVCDLLEPSWLVQDALCFDIDGDGTDEWILLVWKRGSFGPHRPTWVKHDEKGFSQHIFIYTDRSEEDDYKEDWHAIWMSSKLGLQAASFSEGDEIGGTGRHSLDITSPNGSVSRWGWLSWGLTRVD